MADVQPFLVKAVYTFSGSNNDELNFKKGDIITVTQMLDGGWWEGTLDGKTGWFPSNYTKEYKPSDFKTSKTAQSNTKLQDILITKRESMKVYRNLILQNMIETESQHVNEMQALMKTYIRPLLTSEILTEVQYQQLCCNIEEVIEGHVNLLNTLEDCLKFPPHQQRVGESFMQSASHLKSLHETYCSNHPKAVALLNKYREELSGFTESQGASSPGVMVLISGLSQPFRRLEKYPLLLQEMERHIEENHMDRGNVQRAIAVYNDLAASCTEIRRQKEMELEIIMGAIQGWEGEDISNLGEIILMSPVTTYPKVGEKKDIYFVLFPDTLLMLSVSLRMSAFLYEGKLSLSGLSVNKVEDSENLKNVFEITGSMIEKITVSCTTRERQKQWLEALKRQIRASQNFISCRPQAIPLHASTSPPPILSNNQLLQPPIIHHKIWTMSCLRPYPPIRPYLALGCKEDGIINRSPHTSRRLLISGRKRDRRSSKTDEDSTIKKEDRSYEDDALILKVIEAYCTSAKTRHTVNSALLDSPQVLIAEEEKIIIEETTGNQTIVEEKSLVDTVYALKDQLKDLTEETKKFQKGLDDERKARKKLEAFVKKHLKILDDCISEDV